jgi:hypothetical protein
MCARPVAHIFAACTIIAVLALSSACVEVSTAGDILQRIDSSLGTGEELDFCFASDTRCANSEIQACLRDVGHTDAPSTKLFLFYPVFGGIVVTAVCKSKRNAPSAVERRFHIFNKQRVRLF